MKAALCISGQARFVKTTFPLTKRLMLDVNPGMDVFIHTWDMDDQIGQPFMPNNPAFGIVPANYRQTLQQLFKPKLIQIEKPLFAQELCGGQNERTKMQLYSTYQVNRLRKAWEETHGFKYDAVVRFRTDVALDKPYKITGVMDVIHSYIFNGHSIVGDVIYHGGSKPMDIAMNAFERLHKMPNCIPEHILGEQIYSNKLYVIQSGVVFNFSRDLVKAGWLKLDESEKSSNIIG